MEIIMLCIKIFCCRILDVSLGTVRTVLTVRSRVVFSAIVGFIEVLLWFLIVREALNTDVESIWVAIAYAGGYASGTLMGGVFIKLFIRTKINVQIITTSVHNDVITALREAGFPLTYTEAHGHDTSLKLMIFVEIDSKDLEKLKQTVRKQDSEAFISTSEIKKVFGGYFKPRAKLLSHKKTNKKKGQ